jgi:hypothetical protein
MFKVNSVYVLNKIIIIFRIENYKHANKSVMQLDIPHPKFVVWKETK